MARLLLGVALAEHIQQVCPDLIGIHGHEEQTKRCTEYWGMPAPDCTFVADALARQGSHPGVCDEVAKAFDCAHVVGKALTSSAVASLVEADCVTAQLGDAAHCQDLAKRATGPWPAARELDVLELCLGEAPQEQAAAAEPAAAVPFSEDALGEWGAHAGQVCGVIVLLLSVGGLAHLAVKLRPRFVSLSSLSTDEPLLNGDGYAAQYEQAPEPAFP